jgi:hypothetical protein
MNVFILCGVISFISVSLMTAASMMVVNAESEAIESVVGIAQPRVMLWQMIAPTLLSFIVYIPFGVLLAYCMEWLVFRSLRLAGGKASFNEQLYLSSIAALAMAFSSTLGILLPIPCLQIPASLLLIVLSVYLSIYCGGMAYSISHRIHPLMGIAASLIAGLVKMALILLMINALSPALGLPAVQSPFYVP